jgi:hypothetical protein
VSSSTESSKKDKKKTVPKNYYFIEHEVAPKILEWQTLYEKQKEIEEYIENANNEEEEEVYYLTEKQIEGLKEERDEVVEEAKPMLEYVMAETYKVIKGVIFRAEFHKKEKFDTCFQIAVEACIKALPRFNPEFGTAFNYLSLTAKRSIIYYLIKKAKKKHLSLDFEYMDDENLKLQNLVKQEERTLRNLEIENLTDTIDNMIETGNEHKSLHNVNKELRDYLFYHQGKYDKKDFFKWAKADGVSSNLLRKFIKFLKENRDVLYSEVGVY